jgi:hypothetical protein
VLGVLVVLVGVPFALLVGAWIICDVSIIGWLAYPTVNNIVMMI